MWKLNGAILDDIIFQLILNVRDMVNEHITDEEETSVGLREGKCKLQDNEDAMVTSPREGGEHFSRMSPNAKNLPCHSMDYTPYMPDFGE
ncbi:hypothetical protein L2E82_25374 [Cichorium intybus]|uniref:Uncharacterized protein n=1 Tax=Cichorium intybus TaxID=13427 RepID=A0ACB9E2V8_CICIN|nr:hypothetical protein L2E82_25374 [Cichorium intybus]